jgi:hypothetical protein
LTASGNTPNIKYPILNLFNTDFRRTLSDMHTQHLFFIPNQLPSRQAKPPVCTLARGVLTANTPFYGISSPSAMQGCFAKIRSHHNRQRGHKSGNPIVVFIIEAPAVFTLLPPSSRGFLFSGMRNIGKLGKWDFFVDEKANDMVQTLKWNWQGLLPVTSRRITYPRFLGKRLMRDQANNGVRVS